MHKDGNDNRNGNRPDNKPGNKNGSDITNYLKRLGIPYAKPKRIELIQEEHTRPSLTISFTKGNLVFSLDFKKRKYIGMEL